MLIMVVTNLWFPVKEISHGLITKGDNPVWEPWTALVNFIIAGMIPAHYKVQTLVLNTTTLARDLHVIWTAEKFLTLQRWAAHTIMCPSCWDVKLNLNCSIFWQALWPFYVLARLVTFYVYFDGCARDGSDYWFFWRSCCGWRVFFRHKLGGCTCCCWRCPDPTAPASNLVL